MKSYLLTLIFYQLLACWSNSSSSFIVEPSLTASSRRCIYNDHKKKWLLTDRSLCRYNGRISSSSLAAAAKPVEQVDRETGKVLNEYPSVAEAARAVSGVSSSGISSVLRGRTISCGGFFWRIPGDETFPPSRSIHPSAIPVEQVDIDTGTVISVYPTIHDAARTLGINQQSIHRVVTGQAERLSYKGYFWRKVGDFATMPKKPKPRAPIIQSRQRVEQINAETGRVLATFDSITEAAQSLNITSRSIRNTIQGIQKSTRGYTFQKVGKPVTYKRSYEPRPVHQICLETGDIVATFPSQTSAAKAVNRTSASIRSAAAGINSKTSGGYAWRFVADSEHNISSSEQ